MSLPNAVYIFELTCVATADWAFLGTFVIIFAYSIILYNRN